MCIICGKKVLPSLPFFVLGIKCVFYHVLKHVQTYLKQTKVKTSPRPSELLFPWLDCIRVLLAPCVLFQKHFVLVETKCCPTNFNINLAIFPTNLSETV